MMTVDWAVCPECQNEDAEGHYENAVLWQVKCDRCGYNWVSNDADDYDVEVTYEDGSTHTIRVPFSKNDVRGAVEADDEDMKEEISKYLSQFSKPESDRGCLIGWTATFMDEHDLD